MALDATLKPRGNPLFSFTGESILPLGSLELPMTWGKERASWTRILKFLLVDFPKPSYNIIIGRPALNAFQAVISMYHLKIKFPLENGRVRESNHIKECFVKSLTTQVENKRTQSFQGGPAKKVARRERSSGNTAERAEIEEIGRSPDKQPLISTDDRCMLVELFLGKTEIDRTLAEHRLNIDSTKKPVIQKTRHFGPEKDAAIRERVKALLQAGHIVEVQYPVWLSNAVMVEKKKKKWRMCVDYRDLNAACPNDC
ncbi:uncharacterized protein LOC131025932 [Salvia miltiorrhiza]|uniref:uncharacterized protein LOC131025932 n=1 Tax=Salvia miltiorrhiza TaxID=226208 RepID=UPI0025AB6AA5|nr:uncharacterized protein LOC131025932 [Salvia miltiorrhiza]